VRYLEHHKGLGDLSCLSVRHSDDRRIADGRMREKCGLHFGWGDLQALVLDQLLDPSTAATTEWLDPILV